MAGQREQKRIDGDVVDLCQRFFQLFAIRAVRISKHCQLATAIALDHLDRTIHRQAGKVDGIDLGPACAGHVLLSACIHDAAGHQIVTADIRIDDLAVGDHFVQPRDGRKRLYCVNRHAGKALDQLALELDRRGIQRRSGPKCRTGCRQQNQQSRMCSTHGKTPVDGAVSTSWGFSASRLALLCFHNMACRRLLWDPVRDQTPSPFVHHVLK